MICVEMQILQCIKQKKRKNKIEYFKEYMKDVIISNYGIEQSLKTCNKRTAVGNILSTSN